ncbi:dihydrofolate reductase family protein [Phytoactinopolyspora halotolerans]|uniref:Dihydrofolate reductase family protein n=1 Tax=Phytoactinopolyspora halotolerans TaxID=1981512 RepID=A0A6L9SDC2_9ACTN|nr:dihydrofolate reductase family protein [Phytoactinopolyspora halotolerans]NEE02624.1 dihydrofolate reductase family protein [Phytoactinopolyspora halotolerans]
MGTVVATTFVSMDGVLQAPGTPEEDPSSGFDVGGWQVPHVDEDMGAFVNEVMSRADAFLLGRKTYDIFAAHWPRVTDENDPVARALNSLPKYVASTTLKSADWNNTTLIAENVADRVAALKQQHAREIQVWGSGELIQTLREHDLIDEHHVLTFPVVLGAGKKLFPDGCTRSAFTLTGARTTKAGAVIATYHPAGEVVTGSFALEDEVAT